MSPNASPPGSPPPDDFRWQALFQHCTDALFLLDRQRRIRFVNHAWEQLAGLTMAQARSLACRRQHPAAADDPLEKILAHVLCPPAEVLQGQTSHVRRLLPASTAGRRWWDVEFLPLRDRKGVRGVLGRVTPAAVVEPVAAVPLPEKVAAVRHRAVRRYAFDQLPATLPALRRLADQVRLASQVAVPVLLVGEAGTGKNWLARLIHYQGPHRERSFAALDCSRLPVEALFDALFGERGDSQRSQLATLYLKDPASLPRELQARLIERLGTRTGPRVVAGCVAPAGDVQAGRLLVDLHAALGTLVIEVPPLRERRADLPFLVERLLERVPSKDVAHRWKLTPAAWDVVQRYGWPGNLRELADVLAEAAQHAKDGMLDAADLPLSVRLPLEAVAEPERPLPLDTILEQVERRVLELAVRRTGGNKSKAADLLGIQRPRLFRRLKALGFFVPAEEIEIDELE